MDNLDPSERHPEDRTTRRTSSVISSSSSGEDDIHDNEENEEIRKKRKRFVKRFQFQELKTKPKKKEDKDNEEIMGSLSDGEGELKSRRRLGVIDKIRRFGSRDNLDDISKEEKENKKQVKRRGRRNKEEKEEDSQTKRKRSKSREGALAFFDRFKGVPDDSSSDEEEFAQEFLTAANRCRKNHGLESFVASKDLNSLAHDWARALAKDQNIKDRKAQKYGKNIYKKELKKEEEKVKAENVIYSWYQEINNFKFGQNPLDPDITKNATQLLWRDSRVIGVGKAKSSNKNVVFVAAYFSPRGNIVGQFAENVPPLGGFSPRLSKSDKHGESTSSDEEGKPKVQEDCLEKAKESEKGKRKFFTHMFDKLRKTNESDPEISRKKDKNEPHGYIGNRQGKYFVNQEGNSTRLSHGNIYVASNKELEDAKLNLRSQTGESKSSLELDSIIIRSKEFENVERLQKVNVNEDNVSSSSSDEEQQHESLKRNNSYSNKQTVDMNQSSETFHDQTKETKTFDCDATLKTENKVEKCSYNSDDNIKISSEYVQGNSLEEFKPPSDNVPQTEVVYESKTKLIVTKTVTISSENFEEENISDVTLNENEKNISKMNIPSEESSDSDSDSENKVCSDSPEKPGIFTQVKTKVMGFIQSSASSNEDSSEDEQKFQNKNNFEKTVNSSLIDSEPVSSVTIEKNEVPLPVFQKENQPLYNVSFQFDNKRREETEVSCITSSDNEATMSQAVTTSEVLLRNLNDSSKEPHSDNSSSDEDIGTESSEHKTLEKIEIKENHDKEITPSNNIENVEYIYNSHPLKEDETKLYTFEPLHEEQKLTNKGFEIEMLKEDSSSSEEEEAIKEDFLSEKKLITIEREDANNFENEMEKDLKIPNLYPYKNNILQSEINFVQEDSHVNSSDEERLKERTLIDYRHSESLEGPEVRKHDSRERLKSLSSSENEEQRISDQDNELQRAFFDAVKVELFRKHEIKGNTEVTQEHNENKVDVNYVINAAEKNSPQIENTNKTILREEKSCSSDSDASDNEENHLKRKTYPKSPITVHQISQNTSIEDNKGKELTKENYDVHDNNIVKDLVHEEQRETNPGVVNQSEVSISKVKSSDENQQSSSDSDTRKKNGKPPIRRRSFKNIFQGISGRKRNENSGTDASQNKTSDSSDVASGNESSSSKSSIKIENKSKQTISDNDNSHPATHSSDSEGHDGKKRTRRRSFKNLFLDLAITKKHDQTESSNDENIVKTNAHNSANTPTSLKALSTNSISSKNSETESSDIDSSDQKNSKSMKKRRKSFKDIFQDLKITISRDNTESEKSGTSSPANTLSPACDKGESKTPDKPKTESYISRIKHIFESSENLLQKSDNSENHSTKILHENEDFNKQENHIQILEAINKIRKKHNAHTLTLSKELCDIAIERAENLASGIAGHLQNDIGENIFMHGISGTSLKDLLDLAVLNWYKTKSFHQFGVEEYNMKAGSFTQLVWRSSTNLGVGIHKSLNEVPNKMIVVALFNPAGNIKGGFIDEVHRRIHSSESESDDDESPSQKKMVCNESKQI